MISDNTPVIAGVCQYTQPKDEPGPLDPLHLMVQSCRGAVSDTGSSHMKQAVDALFVVNLFSWSYRDVCADLSRLLDIHPEHRLYSDIGGTSPQILLTRAADGIARGRYRAVLIAGAEAGNAVRRAGKGEVQLNWPEKQPPAEGLKDARPPFTSYEMTYDIFAPAHAYAFFENAMRGAKGWTIEEHRRISGRICEKLSAVASQNPHAWSRDKKSAAQIITPSPENRMVAYPYTLRMNANIHVDMTAAVLLTSAKEARAAGVDEERWVYPMGAAGLDNIWNVTRRPTLHDSPALAACCRLALDRAGCTLDDIGFFDFYSCFPWAVEAACLELGVPLDDPRDFSVTGGLPYFGGPGSNYTLHAVASAVDRIRKDRSQKGLVTAMGWFNTKLAAGVYGAEPSARGWTDRGDSALQAGLLQSELPPPEEKPDGRLTVETYIICHDRTGAPGHGTVIGRLDNGRRAMAFIEAAPEKLSDLEQTELIGRKGRVRHDPGSGKNLLNLL